VHSWVWAWVHSLAEAWTEEGEHSWAWAWVAGDAGGTAAGEPWEGEACRLAWLEVVEEACMQALLVVEACRQLWLSLEDGRPAWLVVVEVCYSLGLACSLHSSAWVAEAEEPWLAGGCAPRGWAASCPTGRSGPAAHGEAGEHTSPLGGPSTCRRTHHLSRRAQGAEGSG